MADNFTVDVYFGNQTTIKIQPLFQYDRGIKIRLMDYSGALQPQAQFAFEGIRQTINGSVVKNGTNTFYTITIPDIILYQPKCAHCYLYLETTNEGQTIYDIFIPIIPRERPADGTYSDAEVAAFDALLASLNSTKDKMEALTEAVYAGSGLIYADVNDDHALVLEKAMLDDQESAYQIAVKNGWDRGQTAWNEFVDDLLSHATPDQAYEAAQQASQDAADAVAYTEEYTQNELAAFKQESELNMLTMANAVASRSAQITITTNNWTAKADTTDTYEYTAPCSIATNQNNLLVGFAGPLNAAQFSDIAAATIVATSQNNGYITFTAYGDKPLSSLTFNVIAFLDGTNSQSQQDLRSYRFEVDTDDGCLYLIVGGESE